MTNIYRLTRAMMLIPTITILAGCNRVALSDIPNVLSPGSQSGSIVKSHIKSQYDIWSVDTAFQLLWPDHKIEVGAVPDPDVAGITCFYSRAKTGGIKWWLGLAEDTSDVSVACRQTGPIVFVRPIKDQGEIYSQSSSILFKRMRIVRFYDSVSNSLIYMVYSDKLIDWSPKNSISAVSLGDTQALIKS